MSLRELLQPNNYDIQCDNIQLNTINGAPVPDFTNVITTTDVLTNKKLIVGNGTKTAKITNVELDEFNDISGVDVVNCTTVDCLFVYSSDVVSDYNRTSEIVVRGGLNRISIYDTATDTNSCLIDAPTLTGPRFLDIPDASGTIALTSQIPNVSTMITSSSGITTNRLIKGSDGVRGVAESGISVDGSNNITGVNNINGIAIPASGGTFAKLSDITVGLNLVVAQILSDGSIFYQAGSRTVSVAKGISGVYVLSLSSGALIRSCVATSTLSGGSRIVNSEVDGTNSCTVVCRTVLEAGSDTPFNVHITWT